MAEILAARSRGVPAVGVSGIVGGKALRGPADRMMSALGEESSALGVARRYAAALPGVAAGLRPRLTGR